MTFTDDQIYDAAQMLVDGLEDGAAMEASANAVAQVEGWILGVA